MGGIQIKYLMPALEVILIGYFAVCISILMLIGLASGGTVSPIYWMLQLSFTIVASFIMLLCLRNYALPRIRNSLLVAANISLCIIMIFAQANACGITNELIIMLNTMIPWSILFWITFFITGRAKLQWHQRFYLSVFFVLPTTQLWYLIPPYLDGTPPDFMLWWNQPLFTSVAQSIYDSMKLYAMPFAALTLCRAGWKFTAGTAAALLLFGGYSIIRLFFPQLFESSGIIYYLARFPIIVLIIAIAHFGFSAKTNSEEK